MPRRSHVDAGRLRRLAHADHCVLQRSPVACWRYKVPARLMFDAFGVSLATGSRSLPSLSVIRCSFDRLASAISSDGLLVHRHYGLCSDIWLALRWA
jgi:hypothetical protein